LLDWQAAINPFIKNLSAVKGLVDLLEYVVKTPSGFDLFNQHSGFVKGVETVPSWFLSGVFLFL
jgi:hypothetical protein